MENLRKGYDPNLLKLLVSEVKIKPHSTAIRGNIEATVHIQFGQYNLDDILIQMLDEYGEEELIKRIKALE